MNVVKKLKFWPRQLGAKGENPALMHLIKYVVLDCYLQSFQSRVLIYLGACSSGQRGDSACTQWAGIIAACLGTQHPKQIKLWAKTSSSQPRMQLAHSIAPTDNTSCVADGGTTAFQLAKCADAEDPQETCSQVLENLSAWAGGTRGPNQAATSGTDPTSTGLCTYLRGHPSRVLLQQQASVSPSAKGVDFSLGKSFEIQAWKKNKNAWWLLNQNYMLCYLFCLFLCRGVSEDENQWRKRLTVFL